MRHWTQKIPLLPAEIARLREQVQALRKPAYQVYPEMASVLSLFLDRDKRAREFPSKVRGPLRAGNKGLIPAWANSAPQEFVQVEAEAIFKAHSLSRSSHRYLYRS